MRRTLILVALLLVAAPVLSGCLSDDKSDKEGSEPPTPAYVPDVFSRVDKPFDVSDKWSHTLVKGPHAILDPLSITIDVPLPPEELGGAPAGMARIHMGVFLPDVPEGTTVPVVADIGPYYGESDVHATEPANRLGGFLIENLVPHGFAVAQVSVFGTGDSTHCMDLTGRSEQLGIDAAVSLLGEAEWSNGNVGLIGRSYDGTTPWEAAMFGNPALKTIVPISGLIGMHELMWRNGSAELRGPIMHNVVYGTFGLDFDDEDWQNTCTDYLTGLPQGAGAYLTGDHFLSAANPYWRERHYLPAALENYEGSVFLIHGLQDWNVDPHMAFPTYHLLEDKGLEVKGLFGQWGHNYPDRPGEHGGDPASSVRFDWAEDLLWWFNYYLKGEGPQPDLHVEVQDIQGNWRVEGSYPPRDAKTLSLAFSEDLMIVSGDLARVGPGQPDVVLESAPFENDTHLAGVAHLPIVVGPTGPGGQIYAELRDKDSDIRLGHAIMDLRFHAGGNEMGVVVPGLPITAYMEFFAFDAIVPAGHTLQLILSSTGQDYLPSAVSSPVAIFDTPDTQLRLTYVEPAPEAFFTPPVWT